MHTRYPRAAVAQEATAIETDTSVSSSPVRPTFPVEILWASRPLPVPAGHLVATRMAAGAVEVALVRHGSKALLWVDPKKVLNEDQLIRWKRLARFAA